MKEMIQFPLEQGGCILVEAVDPEVGGLERVARPSDLPIEASQTFQSALDTIKPIANTVLAKLQSLTSPADEIGVEFGLALKANAGAILTSVGADANFKVSLKWKKQ